MGIAASNNDIIRDVLNGNFNKTVTILNQINARLTKLGFRNLKYQIEGYESDYFVIYADIDIDDIKPVSEYGIESVPWTSSLGPDTV